MRWDSVCGGGIRQEDNIGRYGGEEFAILLSNIEQSEAVDLAERLRCSIAQTPCLWQQKETQAVTCIPLTASFGLATSPLDGLIARELLDMADAAMYTAKHTGRNRVCLPDEGEVVETLLQVLAAQEPLVSIVPTSDSPWPESTLVTNR